MVQSKNWDTTDILDPKMEEVFTSYILPVFFLFAYLIRDIHIKEIRLILRRESYVFYHKQRNLQRLVKYKKKRDDDEKGPKERPFNIHGKKNEKLKATPNTN